MNTHEKASSRQVSSRQVPRKKASSRQVPRKKAPRLQQEDTRRHGSTPQSVCVQIGIVLIGSHVQPLWPATARVSPESKLTLLDQVAPTARGQLNAHTGYLGHCYLNTLHACCHGLHGCLDAAHITPHIATSHEARSHISIVAFCETGQGQEGGPGGHCRQPASRRCLPDAPVPPPHNPDQSKVLCHECSITNPVTHLYHVDCKLLASYAVPTPLCPTSCSLLMPADSSLWRALLSRPPARHAPPHHKAQHSPSRNPQPAALPQATRRLWLLPLSLLALALTLPRPLALPLPLPLPLLPPRPQPPSQTSRHCWHRCTSEP